MNNKIAIITSICGINAKLVDPENVYDGIDYIAFVDKTHECKIWEQRPYINFTIDNQYRGRRNAKIYKVLPHLMAPGYDYYFWVDATHEVIQHPNIIIEKYLGNNDIGLFNHTTRNCVYQEANEIIRLNYDTKSKVNSQIEYYKNLNYPENNGLYELPVSIRKNTHRIQVMNLRWWEHICMYSSRDQISLPVVLDSLGITPTILPGFANNGLNQNPIMPQKRFKSN